MGYDPLPPSIKKIPNPPSKAFTPPWKNRKEQAGAELCQAQGKQTCLALIRFVFIF